MGIAGVLTKFVLDQYTTIEDKTVTLEWPASQHGQIVIEKNGYSSSTCRWSEPERVEELKYKGYERVALKDTFLKRSGRSLKNGHILIAKKSDIRSST